MGRDRRNFTDEFKQQMISLFNNGKPRNEIIKEYDLTPSALNNWIKRFNSSFKIDGSRTDEEKRLLQLEKENQQLRMENDILKQAALIMGQK
jgi:transposase